LAGIVYGEMETDAQMLANAIKGDDQDLAIHGVLFGRLNIYCFELEIPFQKKKNQKVYF
jgi:hypothetical protein